MQPDWFKPRNDNCLVELERAPDTTKSGLVALPENARRKPIQAVPARILSTGPGYESEVQTKKRTEQRGEQKVLRIIRGFVPVVVEPGMRVLVEYEAGDIFPSRDGRERRIVRESEILAEIGEGVEVL